MKAFFPTKAEELIHELESDAGVKSLCKASLVRGRIRLDLTCMLLERREWRSGGRWFSPLLGRSVHPTTDSSPTSGRDVFASVLDVWRSNDEFERVILPGSNLGHGFTNVVDKCIAFLWSLWLVCGGSSLATMESVLLDMRSMCTDFGVESGMPAVDNILEKWASS